MFGQLPSYVLANGTVYDIVVANALVEHEKQAIDGKPPTPELSQEQMLRMIKSVKDKEKNVKRTK